MSDIYAVVQNGVVTNLVVWDGKSGFKPEKEDIVKCVGDVGIGWLYDGEKFIKPSLKQDDVILTEERAS
ncbi:hypothetical protein C9189_22185 [Escherichia coli]|uniref:hypothetical protein n=1 Tax=Escherichia coli TaxID=562 RepID=UPI0010ABD6F4|nr:hypothetical protein [Escherichia coli]EKM2785552.1 hypothetical protein [Escherichia coli]MBA5769083.1 hypothetical protein [Escherichia coli]MBA5843364.1 hypothetical protein [Escherichia coli]TJE86803.1 hypothetical protein C9211_22150 [Escherichia coli]TJF78820.1 hypothetical protein C9189_22185 [Escherichia coli]